MKSTKHMFFLIFFHIIKNIYSEGSPGDILGPIACDYFSSNYRYCKTPDIAIDRLPRNCSSFIYMSLLSEDNKLFDIGQATTTIPECLDQLINTNINVLAYYYHGNQKLWCAAVTCDNTGQTAEMNALKSYLDKHPGVKGLILRSFLDMDVEVTSKDCPDYSNNLKKYIELMRTTFPNLSIGVVIDSKRARDWYKNPELAWLDYTVLDTLVDFYVVNFDRLNTCSDEFTKTGCYPLSGNNNNTVEAIKTFLDDVGINATKVYYTFYIYGDSKDKRNACDATILNTCSNVQDTKTSVCMDTLQTLYDKGAFAKNNGAGLIVNYIDGDDYDCTCQCGQMLPAFNALLNGYNGAPPPEPCASFDRN